MIISKLEDAIIERIANAGFVPRDSVASYAGEIDDDVFETVRRLPAIWATFGGAQKPKRFGANKWRYDAMFVTICAARNIKTERAARAGTAGEIGVYQLLDNVHKLLLNQDLGLPVLEFQPGAIRVLVNARARGDGLAAYAQEWHTAWVEQVPPEHGEMWLKTGLNYYLKPGDDVADATDVVTLQENV